MLYAHETLLAEGAGAFNRRILLAHVPDCEEIAGSGTRQIKECYRVISMVCGVRHSQAYRTLDEAKAVFERFTTPIVEIPA